MIGVQPSLCLSAEKTSIYSTQGSDRQLMTWNGVQISFDRLPKQIDLFLANFALIRTHVFASFVFAFMSEFNQINLLAPSIRAISRLECSSALNVAI